MTRRWEPPDDNGISELRDCGMRARVRRSADRSEGWLWVVDFSRRGRGLLEIARGIMPTRAAARSVAEALIDAVALYHVDEGIRRGERGRPRR